MSFLLQFLFLSPTLMFYVPKGEYIDLLFMIIFSVASSFTITTSIYMYKRCNKNVKDQLTGVTGTTIGLVVTACSCTVLVAPLLGSTIISAIAAFAIAYITPLRILSLALLGVSIFFVFRNFNKACNHI